jgi:hypothetical protein
MLTLPKEYRFNNEFAIKLISLSNKKLVEVPFNRAIGFRKLFYVKQEIKNLLPKRFIKILKWVVSHYKTLGFTHLKKFFKST